MKKHLVLSLSMTSLVLGACRTRSSVGDQGTSRVASLTIGDVKTKAGDPEWETVKVYMQTADSSESSSKSSAQDVFASCKVGESGSSSTSKSKSGTSFTSTSSSGSGSSSSASSSTSGDSEEDATSSSSKSDSSGDSSSSSSGSESCVAKEFNKSDINPVSKAAEDVDLKVAYGTYYFLLQYFDKNGKLIFDSSCNDKKPEAYDIDKPEISLDIALCRIGSSKETGSVNVNSQSEVTIKPYLND